MYKNQHWSNLHKKKLQIVKNTYEKFCSESNIPTHVIYVNPKVYKQCL